MTDDALIDALGTRHAPAAGPARIVSLVPSVTELLCDLGLGGQLVGRTGFCVHPKEQLRHVTKVGGTKDVNLEAIRDLQPTHVVLNVDENRRETADALAGFVPHLVVTHPLSPFTACWAASSIAKNGRPSSAENCKDAWPRWKTTRHGPNERFCT